MKGKKKIRIRHIDGLRGVAAVIVMMHHFACAFYPSIIFGTLALPHSSIEKLIATTPLNLPFAGNFAVCIFFVISGYVLRQTFFTAHHRENMFMMALRRYIRLMIPVLGSFFLGYLLLKNNLFYNAHIANTTHSLIWLEDLYNFPPSFLGMLRQGLIRIFWYTSGGKYNSVTWTIPYEFGGSLLVFLVSKILMMYPKRTTIYMALFLVAWKTYFLGFVLGMLASDYLDEVSRYIRKRRFNRYMFVAFIISLFLGSYPSMPVTDTVYAFLQIRMISGEESAIFYHTIAAFFLIMCIPSIRSIPWILTRKPILQIGNISFSLFLVHLLVICSLSSWLFSLFFPPFGYHAAVALSVFLSIPVIIAVAYLFQKLIIETILEAVTVYLFYGSHPTQKT